MKLHVSKPTGCAQDTLQHETPLLKNVEHHCLMLYCPMAAELCLDWAQGHRGLHTLTCHALTALQTKVKHGPENLFSLSGTSRSPQETTRTLGLYVRVAHAQCLFL